MVSNTSINGTSFGGLSVDLLCSNGQRPPGPSLPPNQGPLDGMMMLYRAGQQLIDIMLFDQLTQKDVEASIPGPSLPPNQGLLDVIQDGVYISVLG